MGSLSDIASIHKNTKIEAISVASMIHYEKTDFTKIRLYSKENSIPIRV